MRVWTTPSRSRASFLGNVPLPSKGQLGSRRLQEVFLRTQSTRSLPPLVSFVTSNEGPLREGFLCATHRAGASRESVTSYRHSSLRGRQGHVWMRTPSSVRLSRRCRFRGLGGQWAPSALLTPHSTPLPPGSVQVFHTDATCCYQAEGS